MLFKFISNRGQAGFALVATSNAGEEAPAVTTLSFDSKPSDLSARKLAIASALVFGTSQLDDITTDPALDEETTVQLKAALESKSSIPVIPITSESAVDIDLPIKATTLKVSFEGSFAPRTPGRDETSLFLVPSERYNGALWGIKEAFVSSNAWLHNIHVASARVAAAAGVLFATEFLAKGLLLPAASAQDEIAIRNLCDLAGLETTFGDI